MSDRIAQQTVQGQPWPITTEVAPEYGLRDIAEKIAPSTGGQAYRAIWILTGSRLVYLSGCLSVSYLIVTSFSTSSV
jgi:hypothetical protein